MSSQQAAVLAGFLDFGWDRHAIPAISGGRSCVQAGERLRERISEYVWNSVALQGSSLSVAAVDDVVAKKAVGQYPARQVQQAEDTVEAVKWLVAAVIGGRFMLDRGPSNIGNALLSGNETSRGGMFRTAGKSLRLAAGTYQGPASANLAFIHRYGMAALADVEHIDERALAYFAFATRGQFYAAANRRTALHMMNGLLMVHGYDYVTISPARSVEFDLACDALLREADATALMRFLTSCVSR